MKVAFVNFDNGNGGAAKAALRLAEGLRKYSGVEVDFYVMLKRKDMPFVYQIGGNSKWTYYLNFSSFILERIFFLPFEKSKLARFAYSPSVSGINFQKHIDIDSYDLIHLHWVNFGLLSLKSLKILLSSKKHIVWTLHDMWAFTGGCHYTLDCEQFKGSCQNCSNYFRKADSNKLAFYQQQRKLEMFRGEKNITWVCCSKWLQNQAISSSILKNSEVLQIPNCLSKSEFYKKDKIESKRQLGLNTDATYILVISEKISDVRKGGYFLSDVIEYLIQRISTLQFLVIGKHSDSLLKAFPQNIAPLGHIGDTDVLCSAYNAASAMLMLSIQDNLPNTILEAYACGIPVVGFKNSGIEEMVDHLKTGFLAENRSPESLAEGVKWVLKNIDVIDFSENCLYEFNKKYSMQTVSNSYFQLYQKLTEGDNA